MLPWPEMLRAALACGIAPAAFWALSLKEWRWISGRGDGLDVRALRAMMEADNG